MRFFQQLSKNVNKRKFIFLFRGEDILEEEERKKFKKV